jgi:hypothetical protein
MTGTVAQIEWAGRIKLQVNDEFNRVAACFQSIADKQSDNKRADTEAIIAILEEKRIEVLATENAGCFIRDWYEIDDQVRQMIGRDARYQTIKAGKTLQE